MMGFEENRREWGRKCEGVEWREWDRNGDGNRKVRIECRGCRWDES